MIRIALSVLLLGVGAGTPAPAPPPQERPYDYHVVEIAPGVVGFVEKELNPIVSGNVVAVIGTASVLVFDTGHHPPITRELIAEIRRRTDRPVRYIVVSHWHDDHWTGNAELVDAWPGAEIIAHPFTAKVMEQRKADFTREQCKADLDRDGKPIRDQLAAGKRADGSPIPEASLVRLRRFAAAVDEQREHCDQIRHRLVDRRVAKGIDLDLGGRTVEIRFLGRGNTAGDLVAWLPEARVILTGDLLVHPFPFATASYITEWAAVLRRIGAMDPAVIVPGHGLPFRDQRYLEDVTAALEAIADQARAAWRPGMTVEQLRERIDLTTHRERIVGADPFLGANFDYMLKELAVNRIWQELTGTWKPEYP